MSLGNTESLTQILALVVSPILLILLVYFSSKVLRAVSHPTPRKKDERDGTEELLQLLLISELLDKHKLRSVPSDRLSSAKDQED